MTTRRLLVLFESVRATRATTPRFRSSCRARLESGHARTRAVSNNARRQRSIDRSMDDASFRHKTTTTKERRKDTGRTSVSSWTACPGAYPAYPAMSESPEKVVRTSSRVQTQPSERERPKKRSTTFSSPKAAFLCVVERVVGWWWCLSSFLPFFLVRHFSKRTKKNKQTNKQIANERRKKQTHQSFENPDEILTRRIRTCVRDK